MNAESSSVSPRQEALNRFYQIAQKGAPEPAFPEMMVRMHELWQEHLAALADLPDGYDKHNKAFWATLDKLREEGRELDPHAMRNALQTYFHITPLN